MPLARPGALTCLLIIDRINEFTFDGAARVIPAVEQAAHHIARLKRCMKEARLPNADRNRSALAQMRITLKADTDASTRIFATLAA